MITGARAAWPLIASCVLAACGSKASLSGEASSEIVPECEAYVASLDECARRAAKATAESMAEKSRGLRERLARAANVDAPSRQALRAQCAAATHAMLETCR